MTWLKDTIKKIKTLDDNVQSVEAIASKKIGAILSQSFNEVETTFRKADLSAIMGNALLTLRQKQVLIIEAVPRLKQMLTSKELESVTATVGALLASSSAAGAKFAESVTGIAAEVEENTKLIAEDSARRIQSYANAFASNASAAIAMGLQQNAAIPKVIGNIQSLFGGLKNTIASALSVESMTAANGAIAKTVKPNQSVVLIAAGDKGTCGWCLGRNGSIYKLGLISVPLHPNCRCVLVPHEPTQADLEEIDKYHQELLGDVKPKSEPTAWEKKSGMDKAPTPERKSGAKAGKGKPFDPYIKKGKDYFSKLEGVKEVDALNKKLAKIRASEKAKEEALDKIHAKWKAGEVDDKTWDKELIKFRALLARNKLKKQEIYGDGAIAMAPLWEKVVKRNPAAQGKSMAKKLEINVSTKAEEKFLRSQMSDIFTASGGKGGSLNSLEFVEARAWASRADRSINVGEGIMSHPKNIWHETGHHIEFESENLRAASQAWIESRATGAPRTMAQLTGDKRYADYERAHPDSFVIPYVGKIYYGGATEVMSVGFEHLYSPAWMLKLYWADPEHLFLTMGAILD